MCEDVCGGNVGGEHVHTTTTWPYHICYRFESVENSAHKDGK